MKLNVFVIGLLMLASTSWPLQTFTIEDEDLTTIPKAAETAIHRAEAKDADLQKCELVGKAVDLDGDGRATDWIVTTRDAGEADMPLGPVWVLREVQGSFIIVLSDGGHAVSIGNTKHRGLHDLTVSAESAGWTRQSVWRFDGKSYRKARENMKKATGERHEKE